MKRAILAIVLTVVLALGFAAPALAATINYAITSSCTFGVTRNGTAHITTTKVTNGCSHVRARTRTNIEGGTYFYSSWSSSPSVSVNAAGAYLGGGGGKAKYNLGQAEWAAWEPAP
jgi:hypothetical protein